MKPETLKAQVNKMKWHGQDTVEKLPASQGLLLLELVKRYKLPARKLGYHHDIVAVKTRKQTIAWKDTGTGARFLGLINEDGSVEQHKDDTTKQTLVLKSLKELYAEIDKREYENILGLKAPVTEEEYYDALEALPPMKAGKGWFILSEALTDNLYMKYGHKHCEVVRVEDEELLMN